MAALVSVSPPAITVLTMPASRLSEWSNCQNAFWRATSTHPICFEYSLGGFDREPVRFFRPATCPNGKGERLGVHHVGVLAHGIRVRE